MEQKENYLANNIKLENSKLMYKPPGYKEYISLVDYLNAVDQAIKDIHNNIIALNNFVK